MCAISGIIELPAGEKITEKMLETMKRRGPDGQGVYQAQGAVLLHSRLAIIDPEGGSQPMRLHWNDETYILVYNGELYNTEELRRELMQRGHNFLGHSDTEVVLHTYAEFGENCVERFNGIFAFAVWEQNSRRLFLARDRIGVKPLFYSLSGKGILFASEIKTILAYPGTVPLLDETGVFQILMLGPGRLPGSGVFCGIHEVEPGFCGFFANGDLTLKCYWYLRDREHQDSFEQTRAYVRYLVEDAIKRQMVADVPVGTFLSGGVDSSIITAVCAQKLQTDDAPLHTFSVDYENSEQYFQASRFQPDSDRDYIQIMQKSLHTNHHWSVLTPADLLDVTEAATIARDLPGMADVDFSLLAFCKDIRSNVKVALSGECADEIFGGYPWYRDPEIRSREGFPWAQNTHERADLLCRGEGRAVEFVMDAYSKVCRESDVLPETCAQERRMKEMVNMNFRYFMQTLLDRKDRMSMYHSLEVRVPFCDYRIAEYLYAVPWEFKDWEGREKGLLRSAVEDLLPAEVLYRKKSPYPKTFDPAYNREIEGRFQVLLGQDAPIWYIVNRQEAVKYLTKESIWPWYGQLMRRTQTLAYLLQIDFWLRHYGIEFNF